MVAPVRVKNDYQPPDENDLATPATEITSRHKVDRQSLLPPCRVMLGQDAYRKISKIRNCVTWVTTKLFLHTPVWWWHEAKSADPPLDPS
jgi:hypothetical protein